MQVYCPINLHTGGIEIAWIYYSPLLRLWGWRLLDQCLRILVFNRCCTSLNKPSRTQYISGHLLKFQTLGQALEGTALEAYVS